MVPTGTMVGEEAATPRASSLEFLHRIDPLAGAAAFVATSHSRLAAATCLDGRERFWDAVRTGRIEAARDPVGAPAFLFHQGFCGSTLLSRLLEASGALVLREPQCLVDIAAARPRILAGQSATGLGPLLDFALGHLGETADSVVIKPSNWINPLVGDLCVPGRVERALFLTMDRRAFLVAAFRGGRERIEFCIRLAVEIAAALPGGNATLQQAIDAERDPLDRAAHITALLWAMQDALFVRAIAANGWGDEARVEFADLMADPDAATRRAADHLGLGQPDAFSNRAMERHSKAPERAFHPADRVREDALVEQHHGVRFDAALGWLEGVESALGS